MFKQRVLSALALIPIVISLILYGPSWLLGGLLGGVLVLAAYEWARLIPLHHVVSQLMYAVFLLGAGWLCVQYQNIALNLGVILWIGLAGCILTYPHSTKLWGHRLIVAGFSAILLPLSYVGLWRIYAMPHGSLLVIYLLCLVWAADTGGYLVGRRWGNRRVIPNVSPGKTIAGVLGGAVAVLIVALCVGIVTKQTHIMTGLMVAGFVFVASFFGDLFVSMLKRRVQLKDTGALIPGHGGLLDRIDSLLAAIPVFAFLLSFFPGLMQ